MPKHLFSAIEKLTAPSITLYEINEKNVHELDQNKNTLLKFLQRFGEDSRSASYIYRKFYVQDTERDWIGDVRDMIKQKQIPHFFLSKMLAMTTSLDSYVCSILLTSMKL